MCGRQLLLSRLVIFFFGVSNMWCGGALEFVCSCYVEALAQPIKLQKLGAAGKETQKRILHNFAGRRRVRLDENLALPNNLNPHRKDTT